MKIPNPAQTAAVAVFFLLANVGNCLYAAIGQPPSSGFVLLYYAGTAWVFAWWIIADAQASGVQLPFDMGWFVFLAWPVILPYHLLRTRGARGLITLAALVGIFFVTYFIGVVVFYAVRRYATPSP